MDRLRADSCVVIVKQKIAGNLFIKTTLHTRGNKEISTGAFSTTLSGTNVYCVLARLSGNTLFNSSVRGKLLPNVRQLYPKNSHGTLFIYLTSSVALISSQLSKISLTDPFEVQ